jgi:hypothetical protein
MVWPVGPLRVEGRLLGRIGGNCAVALALVGARRRALGRHERDRGGREGGCLSAVAVLSVAAVALAVGRVATPAVDVVACTQSGADLGLV